MDVVATKPVAGVNDMAKFLRVVRESDINQETDEDISFNGVTQHDNGDMTYNQGPLTIRKNKDGSSDTTATLGDTTARVQQNPIGVKTLTAQGVNADVINSVDASAERKGVNPAKFAAFQKQTVQENSISKFLSIVNKNDVSILSEGANPHKVALPVQMAMQHYQQPKQVERKQSIIQKYFEQVESIHLEEQITKRQLINQYASHIAERVMQKVDEKSVSQAQAHLMAASAHNPAFAKKVGMKQSVAKEFNRADKGKNIKSLPQRVQKEAGEAGWERTGMAGVGLQQIEELVKDKKK